MQQQVTEKFEILGVELQWRLKPAETDGQYGMVEARVPAGVMVPPHQHPEQEAFYILDGTPEFAFEAASGVEWRHAGGGEMINVPSNVVHGFRNTSAADVRMLITFPPSIAGFFEEAGVPASGTMASAPPSAEEIERVLAIGRRHGQRYLPPA